MGDLSTNFSSREFYSPRDKGSTWKDRQGGEIKKRPAPCGELLETLEAIRAAAGRPVNIESGIRSVEYNATFENSSKNSAHLVGDAADIWIDGMRNDQLGAVIVNLHKQGKLRFLAYTYLIKGTSNTRVHVGVDQHVQRRSKWGPGYAGSPEQSWLRRLPLRKLLALMTTLWALALCTVMVIANMDIAPGVAGILQVICGVAIGGYCGSSAWEAVKEAQKE